MSTDLELALRTSGADLTLHHPLPDVLARGARIRRGRHRGRIAVAAGVLAVAGVTVTLVGTAGDPTSPPPATTLRSSPEEQCRQMAEEDLPIPAGQEPVMSSEQDGRAALVYVHDGRYAVCIVRPVDGAWLGRAGGSGPWRPMGRNVYRTYVFSGALVVQVADDVDRVRLDVDGGVFEADAQGGYAVLWFPAAQDDLIGSSVVTAYDADGNVLRQGGI